MTTNTVTTTRIQYTPSSFARTSLLYLLETGTLTALQPHTSARENLGGALLLVVLSGSGVVTVGKREYSLHPGDIAFIDCSKPYSHSTDSDLWTISWCHFNGPSLPTIYSKFLQRCGRPTFSANSTLYPSLLHQLYTTASGNSYIRDMQINTLLSTLLEHVMEDCWNEERVDISSRSSAVDVAAIRQYIDTHFAERINLSTLSKIFCAEESYLLRTFKAAFGYTVIEYLNLVRVNKVKEYLRFGADGKELTIAEIADLTGFNSEN